jgi:hypothetical protein
MVTAVKYLNINIRMDDWSVLSAISSSCVIRCLNSSNCITPSTRQAADRINPSTSLLKQSRWIVHQYEANSWSELATDAHLGGIVAQAAQGDSQLRRCDFPVAILGTAHDNGQPQQSLEKLIFIDMKRQLGIRTSSKKSNRSLSLASWSAPSCAIESNSTTNRTDRINTTA